MERLDNAGKEFYEILRHPKNKICFEDVSNTYEGHKSLGMKTPQTIYPNPTACSHALSGRLHGLVKVS